jgi:hypothetical protein
VQVGSKFVATYLNDNWDGQLDLKPKPAGAEHMRSKGARDRLLLGAIVGRYTEWSEQRRKLDVEGWNIQYT